MAIIAITNRKGGVGKSSIAANLAAELVHRGRRVVVLDADPQRSLLHWAGLGAGVLARITRPADVLHPARFRAEVAAAAREADRVLIDTPPGLHDAALLAMLLADVVLLPCGPSPLDLIAAKDAVELAEQAQEQRGGELPRVLFVPSKVIAGTNLGRELPASLTALRKGVKVLPAIGQRVVVAEAALDGLTVGEYAEDSPAHQEFQDLTRAVDRLTSDL